MNTEDQRLNELFRQELNPRGKTVPSFDIMWEKAGKATNARRAILWKMAASIALVLVIGVSLYQVTRETDNAGEIASWTDPTGSLIPADLSAGTGVLSDWNSPTDFLLTETSNNTQ